MKNTQHSTLWILMNNTQHLTLNTDEQYSTLNTLNTDEQHSTLNSEYWWTTLYTQLWILMNNTQQHSTPLTRQHWTKKIYKCLYMASLRDKKMPSYFGMSSKTWRKSEKLKKKDKRKKSGIRETSNLLTDADSSTHTTVGWTKNTQKPKNKFKKKVKIIQNGKTQKRLEICQN